MLACTTNRVWALDLIAPLKLVMLALCRAASDDGVCDLSRTRTCLAQTGFSPDTLDRLLSRLLAMHRIHIIATGDIRNLSEYAYRLDLEEVASCQLPVVSQDKRPPPSPLTTSPLTTSPLTTENCSGGFDER